MHVYCRSDRWGRRSLSRGVTVNTLNGCQNRVPSQVGGGRRSQAQGREWEEPAQGGGRSQAQGHEWEEPGTGAGRSQHRRWEEPAPRVGGARHRVAGGRGQAQGRGWEEPGQGSGGARPGVGRSQHSGWEGPAQGVGGARCSVTGGRGQLPSGNLSTRAGWQEGLTPEAAPRESSGCVSGRGALLQVTKQTTRWGRFTRVETE